MCRPDGVGVEDAREPRVEVVEDRSESGAVGGVLCRRLGSLGRSLVEGGEHHISLAVRRVAVQQLLGDPVDGRYRIAEVERGDASGRDQRGHVAGHRADDSDLDPGLFDDLVLLQRSGDRLGALLVHVGAKVGEVGGADDAT